MHESGEENGQPFIVCEPRRRALDNVIAGTALSGDRLLDIGSQLADALGAIHRRGLVHGNLKPSNVFITNDGHAAGARRRWWCRTGRARHGQCQRRLANDRRRGRSSTPGANGELFHSYLAPEQIAERPSDHRADIFSAGALLYEMATGRRAFAAETPAQIAGDYRTPTASSPQSQSTSACRRAELAWALEKDPDRRYQSAGSLRGPAARTPECGALGRLPSRFQSRRSW